MSISPVSRLTLTLFVACAALAAVLLVQWRGEDLSSRADAARIPLRTSPAKALPGSARYVEPTRAAFDEILQRPLFVPERRPPAEPAPVEAELAPEADPVPELELRLEGIAVVGSTRVAVLRDFGNNLGLRLTEGMEYQGWKLEEIHAQGAVLTRDGQIQVLKLERE